jgi:poly(3-hydroxybutyrate) depolymerase
VHGTARTWTAIYEEELISFADRTPCAILAPLFPASLNGPNDLDSYKKLHSPSLRSNLALLSVLDEIAPRWPEIRTDKIFMVGFSGGGQFPHRFLYLYPERLAAVGVGDQAE